MPVIGEAIAKPCSPMAFLGQPLIKDNKYVDWENVMALTVMRLYLKQMQYEIGSQCSF